MTTLGGAAGAARGAASSDKLTLVARVGYAVSGVVHLLIGWLALQSALGGGGTSADQSGALSRIAAQPFGELLLWVGVAGFVALGLIHLSRGVWTSQRTAERVKDVAKGVVYLALAWTTYGFASGAGSSSSEQSADATRRLMEMPGGRLLVGVVGLVVLGVAGHHVIKGARKRFLEDLQGAGTAGRRGSAVVRLGMVGYIGKGVALAVVGLLFGVAAWQADPSEATGLDGALDALRQQPFGAGLLVVVAAGLIAYGLYSFVRARYGRIRG